MPLPGLSLVGFMESEVAFTYLRELCILPSYSMRYLKLQWRLAQQRAQWHTPNAGFPDIKDVPERFSPYVRKVVESPRYLATIGDLQGSFQLIEIDPLLAFQFHVVFERVDDHSRALTNHPPLEDILQVCLPLELESIERRVSTHEFGMAISADSLNLRLFGGGYLGRDPVQHLAKAGVLFGASSPLVQVIRYQGRCYLRNGYHRALGLRRLGVTHMPCMLLEAKEFDDIGLRGHAATLGRTALHSLVPPTCGHFTYARAYPVVLRRVRREIHVTWTETSVVVDD